MKAHRDEIERSRPFAEAAIGSGHQPGAHFWNSPESLVHLIRRATQIVLCYELAPTGRIHPGIVRTLLYADTLRKLLEADGCASRLVVRVNDRAGSKDRPSSSELGVVLAGPLPAKGVSGVSALEQLLKELSACSRHFGVHIDQIDLVSKLYASDTFRRLTREVIKNAAAVRHLLSKYQTTPPVLFRPLCAACRHMYSADLPTNSLDGCGTYRCRRCGYVGTFSAEESDGLFAFKLESALMWEYYQADVDLHGQDHIEAFESSCAIATLLSWRVPFAGRVNLTFNSAGKKLSKSRDNFVPVVELDFLLQGALKDLVSKTPWREPLHLPSEYSVQSVSGGH